MPIFDQPEWIQHDGNSINGIDIDATGGRIATCGSDNKVRVWSMRPVLSEAAELDAAVPKQLAVLSDCFQPANCVRFSPSGERLACGSDDCDAYVYELLPGRGSSVFGSNQVNIENWRLKSRLRGHGSNIFDLSWSPDSHRLATASVDNKVKIWDASSGQCVRTLEGHHGHVKGVAWDPFDIFLASQADKEAIVWRLEDGVPVARISEPFVSAPSSAFALRPAWSPDGQTLALSNGYDNSVYIAPLIRRNTWAANEFSLVGHKGTVSVVRYNPHLFVPPRKRPDGAGDGAAAVAADDNDDDYAGGVAAVGSWDKQFSVWHPAVAAPLMVGKGFCAKMVSDAAWSPDGRVLVVASSDIVTTVVFQVGELGRRVPDEEVKALLAQLYGDPKLRSQKSALTAAPDLLQLEARARAEADREERLKSRLGAVPAAPAPAAAELRAAPAPRVPLQNVPQQVPAVAGAAGARPASPAKPAAAGVGGRVAAGPSGREPELPPPKRITLLPAAAAAPAPPGPGAAAVRPMGATTAASAGGDAGSAATAAAAVGVAAHVPVALVPPDPVKPFTAMLMHAPSSTPGEPQITLELQALNTGRDARSRPAAELVCMAGPTRQWSDAIQGHIVSLAGSSRLAAVSTTNGDLMVYSPAGRRLFPPIRLGCPASFMHIALGSTLLLALLADGRLRMWDFASGESVLESSVAPLLLGGAAGGQQQAPQVVSARIGSTGSPIVVLSNAHAYVHHAGLRCWMRVADDAFPASAYTTNISSSAGELGRLQAAAAQRRHPHDVIATTAAHAARPAAAARSEQALLEHNLAAAAALQSPAEWRLWLITYVRRLAADEDEPRLRDLISELMGPLRWSPATHGASAGVATSARGTLGGGSGWEPALASSVVGRWQPSILGLDKRRLLREVVLKEVSKNRSYQQLVTEVLDQLKHIEGAPQPLARQHGAGAMEAGPGPSQMPGQQQQPQQQPMVLG